MELTIDNTTPQEFALRRIHSRLAPRMVAGFERGSSIEDLLEAIILTVQDAESALSHYPKWPEDFATCAECNELGPACMCGTTFPKFVPSKKEG